MKTKIILCLALVLSGLFPTQASEIRVRNDSTVDFKNVIVGDKEYGDVKQGATTDYQTWKTAYRYAFVSLLADSKPLRLQFQDHVGETPLGEGRFTYVLTIKDGGLAIVTLPAEAEAAFEWTTNSGTITVTKYTALGGSSVTIPGTIAGLRVTSIRSNAFLGWNSIQLTRITIPDSVTNIGKNAFPVGPDFKGVYFHGDAPTLDSSPFSSNSTATVYYLPGTKGWGPTFGGCPTALWEP